jgi:hypothetical protein
LPPESYGFDAVRDTLLAPIRAAGYAPAELPAFEYTELFVRGVGESTDVVSKEMFTFTDRGGRSLALRPELTAGVIRGVLEHGLERGQLPVKLFSVGQCFRAERPQAGRGRMFTQVNAEAIGVQGGVVAERGQFQAVLASLGDDTCRPAYRAALAEFLAGLDLDADTRRRAGEDHIARLQAHEAADVGHKLRDGKNHLARRAVLLELAIHAQPQRQVLRIGNLVAGRQERPERREGVGGVVAVIQTDADVPMPRKGGPRTAPFSTFGSVFAGTAAIGAISSGVGAR